MNIREKFPSRFLKNHDLPVEAEGPMSGTIVLISNCTEEKLGDDIKPVLSFQGTDKQLALNSTKAGIIADAYGDETDHWKGQPVALFRDTSEYGGKIYDVVGLGIPPAERMNATTTPQAQTQQAPVGDPPEPPAEYVGGSGSSEDDSLPF